MSQETWVFGYGSLIWRPGFTYADRRLATLSGYRRSFCMASVRYRGTPEAPGLVLALDAEAGATCRGVAYRIAAESSAEVIAYLRERELISYAYDEMRLPVAIEGASEVPAVCYVVNRAHAQYRGGLTLEDQAAVIAEAIGPMGPNAEYLHNTVEGLAALGLEDRELSALAALVRRRQAREPS